MENVIITGATGEIGLALVQELISQDKRVTVITRPDSKRSGRLPRNKLLRIVECELDGLEKLLEDSGFSERFDVFYHLGWDYSRDHNNVDKQLLNVGYTLKAIEVAMQLGCSCFVGAGSQAEYGRKEGTIDESTPCLPETAYGIAKLCAEQMGRLLCEQRGIRFVWPRIFSVYGPGDAESTMIISVIRQLLDHKKPALTKGEQMWDFLYTSDCARALRLLGEMETCTGVYCIGSGVSRPLRVFIEEMRDGINRELPLGFGECPYSERQVMNLSVNIDKLINDTGFQTKVDFATGIQHTIQWCKEHSLVEQTGFGM